MPNQATVSDHTFNDIFVPQNVPSSKISDDVLACHFWFGPPSNQKSWLRLCTGGFLGRVPQITACASQARVNFYTSSRGPANFRPKTGHHKRFFSMNQIDRSSERDQVSSLRFCDKDLFLFFWSSPPNLMAKFIPKEDNIRFGAKYSPDC